MERRHPGSGRLERDAVQPPERRGELVLQPDRPPQLHDLHVGRQLGDLLLCSAPLAQRGQRFDERYGHRARRAEPRAGRNLARREQREAAGDTELLQNRLQVAEIAVQRERLARGPPLERAEIGRGDLDGVVQRAAQEDIEVLVDRGAHHDAAVLRVVGLEVGAPACDRNAQRRARDQHGSPTISCLRALRCTAAPASSRRSGDPKSITSALVGLAWRRQPSASMAGSRSRAKSCCPPGDT